MGILKKTFNMQGILKKFLSNNKLALAMNIDSRINHFRIASLELFNLFFRVDDPYSNDQAWVMEERYSEVQDLLFQKLVVEPAGLQSVVYGLLTSSIVVSLRYGDFAPIMLNREVDSGYWDHSLKEVTREARLGFISFFDFDQLAYRDHRYVRVQVLEWQSQPSVVGKHGLLESQYVRFSEG